MASPNAPTPGRITLSAESISSLSLSLIHILDRMVTLGCMPTTETVPIDKGIDIWHNFGTQYFLERREIGVFNIGGAGSITADGVKYELGYKDCLYLSLIHI